MFCFKSFLLGDRMRSLDIYPIAVAQTKTPKKPTTTKLKKIKTKKKKTPKKQTKNMKAGCDIKCTTVLI